VPLTTPDSASEIIDRAVADVELALAPVGGKPALKNSWLAALINAVAQRVFDFYIALDRAALEALPDTAVANLERWAAIYAILRTPGTTSSGMIVAQGSTGSAIADGTFLASGDGTRYQTVGSAVIAVTAGPAVSTLTSSAGVATMNFASSHGLVDGVRITVTGTTETQYNVTNVAATVVDTDTITYPISGTPSSPATGSPAASWKIASILVESVDPGVDEDQVFNTALRFESPIVGVDDVARVDEDEIGGGADRETDAALRARLLDRIQNPIAHFSATEIIAVAKGIAGVTRVFVQEITPAVGQVTVYFMRDNDISPIPSGTEVAAVKAALDAIRPATSDTDDVIVLAPTAVPTNFTFTAISPDTASMRTAIEANLDELFSERTEIGVDVTEDSFRSAIFNTVDTETGERLVSFTLSAPAADITISAGEIGTLGTVAFP